MPAGSSGTLYCVALPIGNPEDLTLRAAATLRRTPYLACEDTRSAGRLLAGLGIAGPRLLSLFEHNEARRLDQVVAILRAGQDVALISEAGTPTISDPGYRLVARCVEEGIAVVPIPGACAAVAALSASGLPTDRFLFLGFPPRKGSKLARFMQAVVEPQRTAVVYLPARRVPEFLEDLAGRAPEAQVVIARELTKTWEEFIRGTARLLAQGVPALRGECTLVIYVSEGASTPRRDADVTPTEESE
jgi:16S rRNA (cytidine1402-2'-O)-methyltransferase